MDFTPAQLLHGMELLETKKVGKVQEGTRIPIPLGSYAILVVISACLCTFLVLYFRVLMMDGVHLLLKVTNGILASIFGMLDCNKNNGTNCCCKCFKDDITLQARVCQGSQEKSFIPQPPWAACKAIKMICAYMTEKA